MTAKTLPKLDEMAENEIHQMFLVPAFCIDSCDTANFFTSDHEEGFDWHWLDIVEYECKGEKLRLLLATGSGPHGDLFPWQKGAKREQRRNMRKEFPKLLKKVDGWLVATLGDGENMMYFSVIKKARWIDAGRPRFIDVTHQK